MLMHIKAFWGTEAGLALYAMLALALVDFALGVAAAIRDNTFQLDAVAAFARKHIAGRIIPAAILLLSGYLFDQAALTGVGLAIAGAYTVETLASIVKSWGPSRQTQPVPTD